MENIMIGNKDPKQFDWNYVGLYFGNWEEEKLWALDIPTSKIDIGKLTWHLDCPFWESDNGERYTITPRDVLNKRKAPEQSRKKLIRQIQNILLISILIKTNG